MLVQFSISNFLSFKDTAIFDMSAIKIYKEHNNNLIDLSQKEKFLKVATIYGANASGKSNLFFAMQTFQDIIIKSLNTGDKPSDTAISLGYHPFTFLNERNNIELAIVFIIDNAEYSYGFEYNENQIVSEWLYRKDFKTMRNAIIFEREEDKLKFGSAVRAQCQPFEKVIPNKSLVLTFLNKLELSTPIFNSVYDGILHTFVVSSDLFLDHDFLKKHLRIAVDNNKEELLRFLMEIDTGICNIDYTLTDDQPEFISYHKGEDGKLYPLKLKRESEGTLKSIAIFLNAKIAIEEGKSIFVDELNSRLHPLLLKYIIDLFNSSDNKKGQLVYTTHDTTLLNRKFFRRDQIWFVEKNEYGHSKLTALSDFKVRADSSFEKDYLSGVYGGIPFLSDFESLEGSK